VLSGVWAGRWGAAAVTVAAGKVWRQGAGVRRVRRRGDFGGCGYSLATPL